jgi:hypothetical protein
VITFDPELVTASCPLAVTRDRGSARDRERADGLFGVSAARLTGIGEVAF